MITEFAADDQCVATTSGVVAVTNLQAQIDGLAARLAGGRFGRGKTVADCVVLIDLLLLRGHVLGRIADYERAAELADALVRAAPDDGAARLARARTLASFHRFPEALADLDAAQRCGADPAVLDSERAANLAAMGCHSGALVLRRRSAEHRRDFATLGALAVLEGERGNTTEAERLFTEARTRYRGVSPFPVASLDYRRGLMWLGEGDPAARAWFDAAITRVPAYAPAIGHRAEVDAALGDQGRAIDRLRPLAVSSDDPEYAATLARALGEAGHAREAERWRLSAAARYEQLVRRHPEAFADHAAAFWLTVGGDRTKGLDLVARHPASRSTRPPALPDRDTATG